MPFKGPRRNVNSGSPSPGEPEYLVVGVLRRPHGLKGELIMEVITDFPERLKSGTTVYVGAGHTATIIGTARHHPEGLLIKFVSLDTPEEAAGLRRQEVYVKSADRPPLPNGMYYHHELIGFTVVNEKNELIGTLSEILQTGANDVYVVSQDEGGEVLLPAIASVVLRVERETRQIRIREMLGLLDANHKPVSASR
jgi:16S rRNA processing protein RimM